MSCLFDFMSCIFFKYFSSLPNLFMLFAVKLYLPGNFCDDVLHFICHLSYFAERKNPTPKVRGGGPEEQPHVQGVVAVRAQEGRGELLHVQGQEGWPVRRYPSSKIRSSGCTLLEQL